MLVLALLLFSSIDPPPTDQTLVYYNARMALRENQPQESLQLWLLRNTLENQSKVVSAHDPDFHSVTWASLGQLGLCQDGLARDDDGAGLWPLALHNWIVKNRRSGSPPGPPDPFDAFELKRQQRSISIRDVLNQQELQSVRFYKTSCWLPMRILLEAGENPLSEFSEKEVTARVLRFLLERARKTLAHNTVKGRSVIEARIFDLNLKLTEIAAKKAKRAMRQATREAKLKGLSPEAISVMQQEAPAHVRAADSQQSNILRKSLDWSVSEWMSLSSDRRLFLFDHAQKAHPHRQANFQLILDIIDHLVQNKKGREIETWIGHLANSKNPEHQRFIWAGQRGKNLLNLDPQSGFRERSAIALHRGVDFMAQGILPEALRSLAFALQYSSESKESENLGALSRRWLSFVASQYKVTDDLLAMLHTLTPRRDFSIILENLLWHAALGADKRSFNRCVSYQKGRGALNERIDMLYPLAQGNTGRFIKTVGQTIRQYPYFALRFLKTFLQRLETQPAEIRIKHVKTIRQLRELLLPLTPENGKKGGQARNAGALVNRCRSLLDGIANIELQSTPHANARGLSPNREVFAGSIRLAPSDPLPWPFSVPQVHAPSVFSAIALTPQEWFTPSNERVFGWRIGR